jgi:hypothetical protein
MASWRFMDYCTDDGRNLIQEWYAAQDDAVKVAFDATLFTLAATEDWEAASVQEFKVLTERHAGLGEIRFDVEAKEPGWKKPRKRRFRPVGIWHPGEREFILLLGCEKSGRIYTPLNAFDLALEYKAQFEQGRGTIREHA